MKKHFTNADEMVVLKNKSLGVVVGEQSCEEPCFLHNFDGPGGLGDH